MGQELSEALSVLIVGMLTVFFILTMVVTIGNVLIMVINKINPATDGAKPSTNSDALQVEILAAITTTVEVVTQGTGKIENYKNI